MPALHPLNFASSRARAAWEWSLQYLRFGFVGILATLVHVVTFSFLLELFGIGAWIANLLAFSIAIGVSFFGHFHWTFRHREESAAKLRRNQASAFPRFVVTSAIGLCLNTLAAYVVVDVMGQPYMWAVAIMVVFVPPVVFLIAKFWAFR